MFYKVRLYQAIYNDSNLKISYIDSIVVKKSILNTEEVVTNRKIPLISSKNKITFNREFSKNIKKYGYSLFSLNEELKKENIVKERALTDYIESFDYNEFKYYSDEMSLKEEKNNKKIIKK